MIYKAVDFGFFTSKSIDIFLILHENMFFGTHEKCFAQYPQHLMRKTHKGPLCICGQRRSRSACVPVQSNPGILWAYAQADQGLRCLNNIKVLFVCCT